VFETLFLRQWFELSAGRPRRISIGPACGDRADLAGASTEVETACRGRRTHLRVPALCAEPDHRFFLLCAKSKIVEVDMSAEDAATLIMSWRRVQPGSDQQKKAAALAGMANAARIANGDSPDATTLQPAR